MVSRHGAGSEGAALDRIEKTRKVLRERGLHGLIVMASGHEDAVLAPLLRALRASLERAETGGGPESLRGIGASRPLLGGASRPRFGSAWLFVGLSGGLHLLPESPWELGEVQRCGFLPVDPRTLAGEIQADSVGRCRALAAHCGVMQGPIGIAGNIPAAILSDLSSTARRHSGKVPKQSPGEKEPTVLVSAEDIPGLVGRFKTSVEVAEIERVTAASDLCFQRIAELLAASIVDGEDLWLEGLPVTVGRVRALARELLAQKGLSEPEGHLIAAGPRAAEPHHCGRDSRRIGVGECVVVDLFPKGELFSDCTRTFCVGAAGDRTAAGFLDASRAVEEVKILVEDNLRATLQANGRASGFELQKVACAAFRRLGWNTQLDDATSNEGYIHGLGHGVGDRLHEPPWFSAEGFGKPAGEIVAGDVITLEPGLYCPGAWGIRYEDLYAVEQHRGGVGLRRLTKAPWALDPKEFLALSGLATD